MADDQTGASTDTTDQTNESSGNTDTKDQDQQQHNTDTGRGGKEAVLADLASERDRRQSAEKAAKAAQDELKKLQAQHMSEAEKAVAKAKEEGKTEALTVANARLLKAEVRAAAAGKLADPNMAVRLLDLDEFAVDDDGEVDSKAIAKAIDGLVKQYPALATSGGGSGNGDGGARRTAAGTDMNSLIRDRMRRG